jgi:hypothetical protein
LTAAVHDFTSFNGICIPKVILENTVPHTVIEIGDDMLALCSGYVYGRQLTIVLQETVNFIIEQWQHLIVFQTNFSIKHTFTDVKIYSLRTALNIFFNSVCI